MMFVLSVTALLLFCLSPKRSFAQFSRDTVPYCCDFEDSVECAQWHFANDYSNGWFINTAVSSGGQRSLYISANQGMQNICTFSASISYAYRRIHIPAGLYEVGFDWAFLPNNWSVSASTTYFRVFLVPDTTTFVAGRLLDGLSNRKLPQGAISVDENASLGSRSHWTRFTNPWVQVPATNDYYLVFCFVRPIQSDILTNPTAIDSICITPVTCQPPYALSRKMLSGGCAKISWKDRNVPRVTVWELEYGPLGFPLGHGTTVLCSADTITIWGLTDDYIYDFYVRGLCGPGEFTPYSDVLRMRYRDEQQLCLEYDDINSPDVVCTQGYYEYYLNYNDYYPGPFADTGVVDFGPMCYGDSLSSISGSRHTVHTDPNEMDYWSGNQLHTVPSNECSSVRLGCVYGKWLCQSISYNINVDTSVADLLIVQYACVLQNPMNHSMLRKPRFILEILDQNGRVTDSVCLNYDFSGDELLADNTWNIGIDNNTYWRDWTKAGVNLARYHGQQLNVRLVTFACGQGADYHYGYAYFNLKCYKSDIKVEICGRDLAPDAALLLAPPGFLYHWYSPDKPTFSSSDQAIEVTLDSSVYHCDIFLGDSLCKFTKTVVASHELVERKYIHAGFLYTTDSLSCTPRFTVANTSYSSNIDQTNIGYDCDFFYWDFGDSTYSSDENPPTHYYQGFGPYVVSLIAGRTDIGCYDTIVDTITFYPGVLNVIRATICQDSNYVFGGDTLNQSGTYTKLYTSETDCDTTIVLKLKVKELPYVRIVGKNINCNEGNGTLTLITDMNDITWTSYPYDASLSGHEHDSAITVQRLRPTLYTATVDTFPRLFACKATASIMVDTPSLVEAFYRMRPKVISAQNMQIMFSDYSLGHTYDRKWIFHEIPDRFDDKEVLHDRFAYYTPDYESDSLSVTLVSINDRGCEDTLKNTYPILKGEVWVPNVFTPDADENKVLKVGYHEIENYEIEIYNRAGRLMFRSTDPDECWDGTCNGFECPTAAYVYHVSYTTKSLPNNSCEKTGSVVLVR